MSQFKEISTEQLRKNTFQMIGKDWMLVTAKSGDKVNTMTASWGGLGVMWGKSVAFVVIRPQRYTKEFIDREQTFSLSFLEKEYRNTLNYLGTASGRTEDKIAKSGLTVALMDDIPYFDEATQIMFCKKLYVQPLDPESMITENIKSTWYPGEDYHVLYIAEITKVLQKTGD